MRTTDPVLISFGSNIDPKRHIQSGLTRLHQQIQIQKISTVYWTPAIGSTSQPQPDFLNGVLLCRGSSELDPLQLREKLHVIEALENRVRTSDRNAPRTLDLDIVFMGDRVIEMPENSLFLPDPDSVTRIFLAVPSAELLPDFIHPLQQRSLKTVAARFGTPQHTAMRPDFQFTALLKRLL